MMLRETGVTRERRDELIWFIWFIWFVLFIWFVSFNQTHKMN